MPMPYFQKVEGKGVKRKVKAKKSILVKPHVIRPLALSLEHGVDPSPEYKQLTQKQHASFQVTIKKRGGNCIRATRLNHKQ